jgi:prepilin-type N-terminal cleavage/methylation domain-containing protein
MDRRRHHGFSLMELLVVLGVVVILLGLALPTLGRVMFRARMTGRSASTNQITVALTAYAGDYQDLFPLAGDAETSSQASQNYGTPLIAGGYFVSYHDMDPLGMRAHGWMTILLAETQVCRAVDLSPGAPVARAERRPFAVRWADTSFPSQKGILWHSWIMDTNPPGAGYWCCAPGQPKAPIAFADRSVREFAWSELVPTGELPPAGGTIDAGRPVNTTWNGFRGVDLGSSLQGD